MNKILIRNSFRIILLVLLQVLVLKEIHFSNSNYIEVLIYPLAIILLPLTIPQFFLILIAFVIGIFVDVFYQTPGVHTSACLWLVMARPLILKYLEPKSGYAIDQNLTGSTLGIFWFMKYAGSLLFIFILSYFIFQVFTFFYLGEILLKTLLSFSVSFFLMFLIQILFNPKY
jgi:hypothetical protein